jgi:hypothetical protein
MDTNLLETTTEKFCSHCAAHLKEDELFCQVCGESVDQQERMSLGEKIAASVRSAQDRLVSMLPKIPKDKLPKLPPYATPIAILFSCAVGIPYGVHLIDISYDVLSEDFIYQNAEKTLKDGSPPMCAELLLRLNLDRPGKLTSKTTTLLGKTLMMRINTEIQSKDWTSAMKDLKQMPKEAPEYQLAQDTIKLLEQNGTTVTQPTLPGAMPVMPTAQQAAGAPAGAPTQAAQTAPPVAPTQATQAAAPATAAQPAQAATAQPAQAAAAPVQNPATMPNPNAGAAKASATPVVKAVTAAALPAPAAGPTGTPTSVDAQATQATAADHLKSVPGTGLLQKIVSNVMGKGGEKNEKPVIQAPPPVAVSLSAQQNADTAAANSQQTVRTSAPSAVPSSDQESVKKKSSPVTASTSKSSNETPSLIQPGVPIWESFSHGGKVSPSKKDSKRKAIDGKENASAAGEGTSATKTAAGTGQKSRGGEGPKSYNPGDISRYNELLADYFRQHGSAPDKSSDNQGTASEPPSFQEWVSKGKQGFR